MLLNKTCSHLSFLKYVNTRQVTGNRVLGSFFPGPPPYFSVLPSCSTDFTVSLSVDVPPVVRDCGLASTGHSRVTWVGLCFQSALILISLHEGVRPLTGNLTFHLSRALVWPFVLVG